MVEFDATIYVIDDDQAVRESLRWLLESVGLTVRDYDAADSFLEDKLADGPGCVVLDVRMPGMSGLDLQAVLREREIDLPVIVITGHGDVPMAIRAMKMGAMDFIEKPFNDQVLLECIHRALDQSRHDKERTEKRASVLQRLEKLTGREREVMEHVVTGMSSREVANKLGISTKTVEVHRAKVMDKMRARSVAELVRMAFVAGAVPDKP